MLCLAALVGCSREPKAVRVELTAIGTSPAWSVEVASNAVTFRRASAPTLVFPSTAPDTGAGRRRWRGRRALTEPLFELMVEPQPCRDGTTATEYPFTAAVTWADSTWSGCAVDGAIRPTATGR
ncbi:MAG: hypothetical protein SFW08_03765 [Gemmatimonadaceae bacterium]|nr:hypothetical protein [Gemmatimonadaceae bacterium]